MTEHIDRDALREEALGAIEDGSYDGAGWASYVSVLSEALDQAESRIKAVRDVLDQARDDLEQPDEAAVRRALDGDTTKWK